MKQVTILKQYETTGMLAFKQWAVAFHRAEQGVLDTSAPQRGEGPAPIEKLAPLVTAWSPVVCISCWNGLIPREQP